MGTYAQQLKQKLARDWDTGLRLYKDRQQPKLQDCLWPLSLVKDEVTKAFTEWQESTVASKLPSRQKLSVLPSQSTCVT